MASGISALLIIFILSAIGILAMTIYAGIYHMRKDRIERIFKYIKERVLQNKPVRVAADNAIATLYANQVSVITPIYIFVGENRETDLLIISLLRAALRYFNLKIEKELDGRGIVRLSAEDRKSLGLALKSQQNLESTIDFTRQPTIRKIDVLLTECSRASSAYSYLLKENGMQLPQFIPLFFIAQKTEKDPCRILFPHHPE